MKIQSMATACLVLSTLASAAVQEVEKAEELRPIEMGGGAEFGHSLALDGDLALVGTPGENALGAQSGSVRVMRFAFGAWEQEAVLTGSDGTAGSRFGESVALDGERAIVGAPEQDGGAGAAYLFLRDDGLWTQEAKLTAEGTERLGQQVALCGDTALVVNPRGSYLEPTSLLFFRHDGASWIAEGEIFVPPGAPAIALIEDVAFYSSVVGAGGDGMVHVFGRDDHGTPSVQDDAWSQVAEFGLGDGGLALLTSLAADDARLVVGEMIFSWSGLPSKVLVLDRDDGGTPGNPLDDLWLIQTEIVGPVGWYGHTVALDADRILVGNEGLESYLYRFDGATWPLEALLENHETYMNAVALSSGRALLAYAGAEDLGPSSGAVEAWEDIGGFWASTGTFVPDGLIRVGCFGCAVDLVGGPEERAIVGAQLAETAGEEAGAAYVFRRAAEGWVEEARLLPSGLAPGDHFGSSVAVDGDRALVGAQQRDGAYVDQGAAYVFRREAGTWMLEAELAAPVPSAGGCFGSAVALLGDVALVGAYADDQAGAGAGAAYVYRDDGFGWALAQTLHALDAAPGANFGRALALGPGRALVGSPGADGARGACYVFRDQDGNWVEEAQLAAADGAPADFFGNSCSLFGESALVGAFRADGVEPDMGAAYTFVRSASGSWWQEQKLVSHQDGPTQKGALFGTSVALAGDGALVGMPYESNDFHSRLSHWVRASTAGDPWFEVDEFADEITAHPWDKAGYAVAHEAGSFLVGSPRVNETGDQWAFVGSAFVGTLEPALTAYPASISASAGGVQMLELDGPFGKEQWYPYLVLGSLSGTDPGFALGSWTIPLNQDAYFHILVNEPDQDFTFGFTGIVQSDADMQARLTFAPGMVTALVGTTVHHAVFVYDVHLGAIAYVSNPAALEIVP